MRHLLGLKDLETEKITEILDRALFMKKRLYSGHKGGSELEGRSVATLFYENSTRTRTSFEAAAKFLGAAVTSISVATSSVQKGETLLDTGKTLEALHTDIVIIRHSVAGAPELLAKNVSFSVVNAGDGMNEHPTQALLDMFTMKEHFGKIAGLKVAIIGDILHSRVARSNLWGLTRMGAEVRLFGPTTLMPPGLKAEGSQRCDSLRQALEGADVVMALRIQLERQKRGLFPSLGEYAKFFGLNEERMKWAAPHAVIMHPGPVNRGVELTTELADSPCSLIHTQVENGLAVRMAVLSMLSRD